MFYIVLARICSYVYHLQIVMHKVYTGTADRDFTRKSNLKFATEMSHYSQPCSYEYFLLNYFGDHYTN